MLWGSNEKKCTEMVLEKVLCRCSKIFARDFYKFIKNIIKEAIILICYIMGENRDL